MKSGMRETLLQEWEHTEKLIRNELRIRKISIEKRLLVAQGLIFV